MIMTSRRPVSLAEELVVSAGDGKKLVEYNLQSPPRVGRYGRSQQAALSFNEERPSIVLLCEVALSP